MVISTPVNRERVRNHLTYNGWKYLMLIACSVLGWSLIYTTTAYRSPQDKRIDLYVYSSSATSEKIDEFVKPIWEKVVPEMELVDSVVLTPMDEYSTVQRLTTYVYAGEGDIYFLPADYFKSFATQQAFLPLEDLVSDGTLDVSGIDVTSGYVTITPDSDNPAVTEQHLYGIPASSLYGYMDGMLLDNRGLYICVLVANQNDANVVPFLNALVQAGRGEAPDWLVPQEEQAKDTVTDAGTAAP